MSPVPLNNKPNLLTLKMTSEMVCKPGIGSETSIATNKDTVLKQQI